MKLRHWATRHLQTGDLSALQDLKNGKNIDSRAKIERLRSRGFVGGPADRLRITIPGRLALLLKRLRSN